ncbi:KilA-N domain-containing protein [Anaerovibrio lipolyticus DSM 3074]|uniref:KilA-N domain-containing protein n=1 Tax=Anaerovibrio lipolyticus DSM 3074 TaxID=1120997 RepID=A0A1M6BVQ6_9FIRM|nr:KilA-N domain-containing protein [Anaerovibrio lipolyticus]SHI52876.1 KilA-N domain-containing protein [Anaerovibrio lipolyticus DSM 3074]
MTTVNGNIEAKGLTIRANLSSDGDDYISLTDIAKYEDEDNPRYIIQNWMRNRSTVDYLAIWEELHNPNFNRVEFEAVTKNAGRNAFVMTPQKWIDSTNAIGIISKSGRYGGTYAHSDIAFEFASWISAEFKLYIIKDYQRLKQAESDHLSLDWSARREIAKTNYKVHTDAIKEHIIDEKLPARYVNFTYANEADVINVALFGITAKEWRDTHPKEKGNVRDAANLAQLIILANLEMLNAEFIKAGLSQRDRLQKLRDIAVSQLKSISNVASVKRLQKRFGK